jgi:hypothetical protein
VSLVVAQIHDGGISLVADTKITRCGDEAWTRRVFRNALPKLVIMRDDIAVGFAGEDPAGVLQRLVGLRGQAVKELLASVARIDSASFVVATLAPAPRLWRVSAGKWEERSAVGRSRAGDHDAYELFQQRYHEWPEEVAADFRLMSSMQWLLSFDPVPSVGGYLTRVATSLEGFRFVADPMVVGPWFLEGLSQVTPEGFKLMLEVPVGGDSSGYQVLPAVGRPPTVEALAYYVPQARVAWLFRHEAPWESVTLQIGSIAELLESAADHGQTLAGPPAEVAESASC